MTYLASFFPLLGWWLYGFVVGRIETRRPSLSAIMSRHRHRWVANAVKRDTPMDAILTSNLMGSISFFASTTVLLIIALFTAYGQFESLASALEGLRIGPPIGPHEIEAQLFSMVAILTLGFLSFTLSLRQFNHFCIMLGAAEPNTENDKDIAGIAELNTIAARNFNQGIRAYYFAMAAVAWFWSPWGAIAGTLAIAGILMYREFYSPARKLVEELDASLPKPR